MPQYSVVNLLYLHHEGCSHKIGCHKPRMSCVILKAINSILQIKKFTNYDADKENSIETANFKEVLE